MFPVPSNTQSNTTKLVKQTRTPVVYNRLRGDFRISPEALKYGRYVSKDEYWGGEPDSSGLYGETICRHDPILVFVVGKLQARAGTQTCDPRIFGVTYGTRYRIDHINGLEIVVTVDDYAWIVAK